MHMHTMMSQKLLLSVLFLSLSPSSSFVTPQRGRRKAAGASVLIRSQTETATRVDTVARKKTKPKPTATRRRTSDKWERMVLQLQRYFKQHGHSLVSKEENPELAQWCKTVRCNYRHILSGTAEQGRPTLSEEKLKSLSDLKFVWNVQSFLWQQNFQQLCAFRAHHGHCQVPLEEDLGMWVHNQKCSYRLLLQGKSCNLTPDRLAALSSIGFWEIFQTNTDTWNQRFQELQEFHHAFGHSNVPEDYTENYQLGQWVMNQRLSYKTFVAGLASPLTPAKIASLEQLEFRWNLQSYNWFCMLQRLGQYAQEHGHVQISTSNKDNKDLKLWLVQQRHAYQRRLQLRSSSMTDQRQAALETIPNFEWNVKKGTGLNSEDWDELFAGIREKGIVPGMRTKQHWFEGQDRFVEEDMDLSDDDLQDLWNQEGDEE